LNLLKVLLISSILIGCTSPPKHPELELYTMHDSNLDSLFEIGDSVLSDLYIQQAQQRLYTDKMQEQLNEKQIREERERIIYRDTIIYRKEVKTLYTTITDTIRDTIVIIDTIRQEVWMKRIFSKKN